MTHQDEDDDVEIRDVPADSPSGSDYDIKNGSGSKSKKQKKTTSSRRSQSLSSSQSVLADDDEHQGGVVVFSSQVPEASQCLPDARPSDRNNLNKLSEAMRGKAIQDLTRLILFKGMAGEAIDRAKCMKEAGIHDARISTAALEEANRRLQNLFDFELRRLPAWMERMKDLPAKFRDRYYLINKLEDQQSGAHSKALHAVHETVVIEHGVLMAVLAFCYCQGESRGDGSRWILDHNLYYLLHKLDENIPEEPPRQGSLRGRSTQTGCSPNLDVLLPKFVQQDYLWQVKAMDLGLHPNVDENSICYTMGPRAVLEIGRKQVLYFCAEVLDEDVDPTMMLELEQDEEESPQLD